MPYNGYDDRRGDRKDRDSGRHNDDRRQSRRKEKDVEVVGEKRASKDRKHVRDHRGRGNDNAEQGHGSGVQGRDQGGQVRGQGDGGRSGTSAHGRSNNRGQGDGGAFGGSFNHHDDSGFGPMNQMPPYEDPYYGGNGRGGRGGWYGGGPYQGHYMESPGFGRGMVRPPLNSTPNFCRVWSSPMARGRGRGRGRGGSETAQRGDAGGSGTAAEVLAKRVQEVEEENADLKKELKNKLETETPKKKTVEELNNLKEKNCFLKARIQSMEALVDEKNEEIANLKELEAAVEGLAISKEKEEQVEEDILKECSDRVKKHLKIIIENKMSQEDLKSCLRLLLLRLDEAHVWGSILRLVEEVDNQKVRDNLIEMLRGGEGVGVDINGGIDDDDSAPSPDTDDETGKADVLKPKKLFYEGEGVSTSEPAAPPAKRLDTATKKKLCENLENAKNLKKLKMVKRKEIAEVQATVEMESGDKSINECFDDLLFTLTNVHPGKADESSRRRRKLC